jgi:hypothetical protein
MKEKLEAEAKEKAELREQIKELLEQLRQANKARDNAEIEAKKDLFESEKSIRAEAEKDAAEKQRLEVATKDKTINDLKRALEDAQRKAAQGSQQMQGEIAELDFENAFANEFRDDEISPVSKLKEDLRSAKANIPVIITEVMPKDVDCDIAQYNGIWVCKPSMALVLSSLLRKGLLDVGRHKTLSENQGTKAGMLYGFVTSHEFVQQVEGMVETYKEMLGQIVSERASYERGWAKREKQAQKLLLGTANIVGSMQEYVGQTSMPKIKGLELLEPGDESK